MAFGLSFGGSKSKTSSSTTEDSTTNITKDTTATSDKTGSQTTTGSSQQAITTLDQETQDLLSSIIQQVGGTIGTGSDALQTFATQLVQRGQETEKVLADNIQAILTEAQRAGQKEITSLNTQLASSAGSRNNTFVTGATAEAQSQLASQLAGKEAELNIAAREAGSRDLLASVNQFAGVQGQQSATLANLSNVLKGATTVADTTSAQQVLTDEQLSTVEKVSQLIDSLTKATGVSSSKSGSFSLSI